MALLPGIVDLVCSEPVLGAGNLLLVPRLATRSLLLTKGTEYLLLVEYLLMLLD